MSGEFGGMPREQILIYIVVIGLVLFRASRPQRISVARIWIFAGILMVLCGFVIYVSVIHFNPPPWQILVSVVVGLVAGIPLGLFRGYHTRVSATNRRGVMQLGPSWMTAIIYLAAFGARTLIRYFVPATSAVGMVVSDGLMVFAIGIIGATYFAVYRKYEALDHAGTAAA